MPPGEVLGTAEMSHQYRNPKQKTKIKITKIFLNFQKYATYITGRIESATRRGLGNHQDVPSVQKSQTEKKLEFWKARNCKFWIRALPKRRVPREGLFQDLDKDFLLFTAPKRRPGADFIRRIRFLSQFCRLQFVFSLFFWVRETSLGRTQSLLAILGRHELKKQRSHATFTKNCNRATTFAT